VAVGGSAASLGRVAGPHLDEAAFDRAQALLAGASAGEIAARYGLAEDRVRLLPAGLVILQAAAQQFGLPLIVGGGGIREGVLLESCGG
jgi:exopolyphosphatase/guanosine-5'-triphosphate,3'-diphosphate pyrophosphatase